jgi:hypothetical protein
MARWDQIRAREMQQRAEAILGRTPTRAVTVDDILRVLAEWPANKELPTRELLAESLGEGNGRGASTVWRAFRDDPLGRTWRSELRRVRNERFVHGQGARRPRS